MTIRRQLDLYIFAVGVLLVALTVNLGMQLYVLLNIDPPRAIRVHEPTEENIKEQVRQEHLKKAYARAARIAAMVYRKNGCRETFADLTGRYAVDLGISPRILAALVFVESSCNPNVVSTRASVGLTQVNEKVWKYSWKTLKDPDKNLKIGATILAKYVHKYGLVEGLHAYNGFGNHTNEYAQRVFDAAGLEL
jgi:soluble lytic murein transglycosylase-like protein